ncbi:DUF6924 domain-containing protein [Actinoallomurus sp. CA-150999]|uniref:DUF6924 domain-containing protein n=1 Tax=Actinoallomurus sp. CA-150999 TaxID=3239887 RepID=UPI003D8AEAED
MSFPELPRPEPGEVLLLCTCYDERGMARWGGLLDEIGGRREGDVLVVGDSAVRLRPVEDCGWDFLHGGNAPALVADGGLVPPVVVLADIPVAYGDGPLLVDLAAIPGRGVRVPSARLGEILAALLDGTLEFDYLVRDMDVYGMYQGDGGRPAFPAPTTPLHRSFPALPAGELLVRTCFDDEEGWRALLDELGGADGDGWVGADLDPDEIDVEHYPLTALVVDDRAFEGLLPGQVPALVPPPKEHTEEHTRLVVLADARTFAESGRPLTVVDLYDTPGQPAVLPCRMVGSMACNLEIANMDFHEFVAVQDTEAWWEGS